MFERLWELSFHASKRRSGLEDGLVEGAERHTLSTQGSLVLVMCWDAWHGVVDCERVSIVQEAVDSAAAEPCLRGVVLVACGCGPLCVMAVRANEENGTGNAVLVLAAAVTRERDCADADRSPSRRATERDQRGPSADARRRRRTAEVESQPRSTDNTSTTSGAEHCANAAHHTPHEVT